MAASQPTLSDFEEWRDVPGWSGYYQVSNHGRVRSLDRTIITKAGKRHRLKGKAFRPARNEYGYPRLSLKKHGAEVKRYVHHLVLEAFVGPCPPGMEACHWNDIPDDNRLENLRWGTSAENKADMARNGGNKNRKKSHCVRGHLLASPNLRNSPSKPDGRECLSCRRATARAAYNPCLDIQKVSDAIYQDIISGTA